MNGEGNNNEGRVWPVVVAALGACLIFVALISMTRHYSQPEPLNASRAAERSKALAELRATEADALENPGWIDPVKQVVRLPIAVALQLAEREWRNPAQARSNLIARVEKATAPPPKAPEKPNVFD